MLRITILNEIGVSHFIMEGRLAGEWVKELERCWHQVMSTLSPPRILVELRDVRFVDEEGWELLQQMARSGAELIADDLLMKSIVEENIH